MEEILYPKQIQWNITTHNDNTRKFQCEVLINKEVFMILNQDSQLSDQQEELIDEAIEWQIFKYIEQTWGILKWQEFILDYRFAQNNS